MNTHADQRDTDCVTYLHELRASGAECHAELRTLPADETAQDSPRMAGRGSAATAPAAILAAVMGRLCNWTKSADTVSGSRATP